MAVARVAVFILSVTKVVLTYANLYCQKVELGKPAKDDRKYAKKML